MPGETEERSPEEEGDEVIRRTKNALGLGGDVLAEMKVKQEKRDCDLRINSEPITLDV